MSALEFTSSIDTVASQEHNSAKMQFFECFVPTRFSSHLLQDLAKLNISGLVFDFVRSIRVFDVRITREQELGRDADCSHSAKTYLKTFGAKGDMSWAWSLPQALAEANVSLVR
ncbi:hypothetical protein [Litoreibacter albidus]|uniref:hypothetical protein n=1 Tax=Litoreibacter albidus TaxID=670155 RepID=UPI003736B92A